MAGVHKCEDIWKKYFSKSYLTVVWEIPSYVIIKNILVDGIWHVNGLHCPDVVDGEVYKIQDDPAVNPDKMTTIQRGNKEIKRVNVYKDRGFIAVRGVEPGDNIRVYTTTGSFVKSLTANSDLVQIKLPAKRLYLVRVAEACYRIAL